MTAVYVVVQDTNYEGIRGIAGVFKRKKAAEDFVKSCNDYNSTIPLPPKVIENTPTNDELFDKWWKKMQRWQKKHPGGEGAQHYNFCVISSNYDAS
jgi:hypothetical protein